MVNLRNLLTGAVGAVALQKVAGDGHDFTFDWPNRGSTFMAADELCMNYCNTYFQVCATQNDFFDEDEPRGARKLMMSENEPEIDRGGPTSEDIADARENCLSACMQYPRPMNPREYNDPAPLGANAMGDTIWCRMTHLRLVEEYGTFNSAVILCPAAGPQGGGVCTESLVDGYTPHEQYRQGEATRRHLGYCDLLGDDTIADCTKAGITDETLPYALGLLPDSVTMIILNSNPITELGSDLFDNLSCPKCIKAVFAQECMIETIEEEAFYPLENLEAVYLDANRIEELPEYLFSGNEELKEVSIAGNRITGELPEDLFGENDGLERLSMSGNSPIQIPEGFLNGLSELTALALAGCGLTELPDGIFDDLESLAYLFLGENRLGSVDASWFEGGWGSNLLRLGLMGNDISSIDDGAFETLESLEFCLLDNNDGLTSIPDGLFEENDNLIAYTLGSPRGQSSRPSVEGTYAVSISCGQGGDLVGPVDLVQYVWEREDGAINIFGGGNHTLNLIGEGLYTGATSWLPSYPDLFYSTYPPEHLPPVQQVSVQFTEDYRGYWIRIMQQQPGPATVCHGYATVDSDPVNVFEDGPLFPEADDFIDRYEVEVTCMEGEEGPYEWEATMTISTSDASDASIYWLESERDDGSSYSMLARDGMDPYMFKGIVTNYSDYNMEPSDPAWFDATLLPVANIDLWFGDDYETVEGILVRLMPTPNFVCTISGAKDRRRRKTLEERKEERKEKRKLDGHLAGTTCDPLSEIGGWYFSDVTCSRYLDSFDYEQDSRVRDLGDGFYKITSQNYLAGVWDDVLNQESIMVEDPHRPGRYYGAVYARNDYRYKIWNVTNYPLLMFVTAVFEGEDDEVCTGFNGIFQSFRGPTYSPRPLDTVTSCLADSYFKRLVAVINQDACDENLENCVGVCYDGPYEYMEPCVAGFGEFAAPSFPREALLPQPMLVEQTCQELGFVEEQLFEACPDPFYHRSNGVCVKTTPGFDIFQFFPEIQAGSPFLATGLWPDWQDWGIMWMGDNPQCDYVPPGQPDVPTNCNPAAGRYECTTATCFSGNENVLDGTPGDAQSIDILDPFVNVPPFPTQRQNIYIVDNGPREYSLQYFDVVILEHPTNMWLWNATVKQTQLDENKLIGNVYWNTITGEGEVDEDVEIIFSPSEGCSFEMTWQGFAGAPEDWPNNVHDCNWRCERLRN